MVFIVQLTSTRRLAIVYIKQPLLVLYNYPQSAVQLSSQRAVIVQLSSARRLAIVYIKQPLLFLSFNNPQRAV